MFGLNNIVFTIKEKIHNKQFFFRKSRPPICCKDQSVHSNLHYTCNNGKIISMQVIFPTLHKTRKKDQRKIINRFSDLI